MASRHVIIDKTNLLKSFNVIILNSFTSEEDMEKEIIELETLKGMFNKIFD